MLFRAATAEVLKNNSPPTKKTREKTVGMMRSLSAKGDSVYFKAQDFLNCKNIKSCVKT